MTPQFYYTDPDTGLYFEWEGGEYIDVADSEDAPYATQTINVWDHASATSEIERTQEAFEAECLRWIKEDME